MRSLMRPPAPEFVVGALLAVALIVLSAYGIGGVLVLAAAGLLVGNHLTDRYVVVHLGEHYPRHGDRMD